jgi:hypothetical protein
MCIHIYIALQIVCESLGKFYSIQPRQQILYMCMCPYICMAAIYCKYLVSLQGTL